MEPEEEKVNIPTGRRLIQRVVYVFEAFDVDKNNTCTAKYTYVYQGKYSNILKLLELHKGTVFHVVKGSVLL